MRDNIIKKRVRADEVAKKSSSSTSREVQKLQNGTEEDSEKSWNTNDLSGDYQSDSYTCPSCFKKFERKTVYTNHVLACSEAKCRENTKLKKQKAKEEAKIKEAEENNTQPQQESSKRKSKKVTKAKPEVEGEISVVKTEENSSLVDWNLDDEEEKMKLEKLKQETLLSIQSEQISNKPTTSTALPAQNISIKSDDDDDDEEESALVIDEKIENDSESTLKCPQCDKLFENDEKLKYHTNTFHSRQKRFKCKMCEYQGYRKKDTMNHLNYVHNIEGDKEKLESLMESVMKSMDEESLAKQNELKRNQLKIKRRMERQKKRQSKIQNEDKTGDEKPLESSKTPIAMTSSADAEDSPENALKLLFEPPPLVPIKSSETIVSEFKEPPTVIIPPVAQREPAVPPKLRRKSLHTSVLIPPENDTDNEPGSPLKIPKMFIKATPTSSSDESPENSEKKKRKRAMKNEQVRAGQSLLDISKFGKVIKRSSNGGEGKDGGQRPIRNRIKPVDKDFLYDLSDLLKKDADAYREQVVNSSTVNVKRELRKRAMSTHTRETPGLNSFDDSSNSLSPKKISPPSLSPLKSPTKDEDDIPLMRIKENKLRRMSVFQTPSRPIFPTQQQQQAENSQQYSRSNSTNPNTGAAYKMALKEFNANRASLFEPKFLWTICFNQDQRNSMMSSSHNGGPSISAASTILQRLSGKIEQPKTISPLDYLKSKGNLEELDIPNSEVINMNPEKNGLIALALKSGNDVCVLQECSPESDGDSEKPSVSSSDIDVKKLSAKSAKTKKRVIDQSNSKAKKPRKNPEKRKSGTNGQGRRLTVMQRLQENKIRKSREQLFQRLIMDRQSTHSDEDDEDDDDGNDQSSPIYNLFSES